MTMKGIKGANKSVLSLLALSQTKKYKDRFRYLPVYVSRKVGCCAPVHVCYAFFMFLQSGSCGGNTVVAEGGGRAWYGWRGSMNKCEEG